MSFAVYRPLRQSSSVEHSVNARFTTSHEEELLIARVNILEVWRPPKLPERPCAEWITSYELHGEINSLSLLKINFDVFTSEEIDIWKNRLPEIGLDCIVMSFDEGKISLVAFDPLRPRTLRTVALFNFEETAKGSELKATKIGSLPTPSSSFGQRAFAFVDPKFRAIATVVYSSYLAVIPIRETVPGEDEESKRELIRVLEGSEDEVTTSSSSSESDDEEEDKDKTSNGIGGDTQNTAKEEQLETSKPKTTHVDKARKKATTRGLVLKKSAKLKRECGNDHPLFGTPHLLPLSRYGIPQHGALNACFAEGESRPTAVILYSTPVRTWAPRIAVYRHTCAVAAICLVPEDPLSATRVWSAFSLPHDSQSVVSVPQTEGCTDGSGGCLVVSTNSLTFVSSTPKERYTMALNGFASTSCMASRANPLHDINGKKIDMAQTEEPSVGSMFDDDKDEINVALTLESSRNVWISSKVLLFTLPGGGLLQVRIAGRRSGKGLSLFGKVLDAVGGSSFTCVTAFQGGTMLYFGSRSTDCVFVQCKQIQFNLPVMARIENTSKRMKQVFEAEEGVADNKNDMLLLDQKPLVEDDEILLYSDSHAGTRNGTKGGGGEEEEDGLEADNDEGVNVELSLEIVDVMPVLGPIADMDYCDATPTAPLKENAEDEDRKKLALADKQAQEYKAKKYFSEVAKILERAKAEVEEDRKRRAAEAVRRDLDLIACGPKGRNGGPILSFQSGFRPIVRNELAVFECGQMFALGESLLVSESNKTRVFVQGTAELNESTQHPFYSPNRATLLAHKYPSTSKFGYAIQVFADEIRYFPSASSSAQFQSFMLFSDANDNVHPLVTQCCVERDFLFLVMSDARIRTFRVVKGTLVSYTNPIASGFGEDASLVSAYVNHQQVLTVCCVRAGTTEAESGLLETYEFIDGSNNMDSGQGMFRLVFKSSAPLPLCLPSLTNSINSAVNQSTSGMNASDEKETSARSGVLTNARVVDFVVTRCGDGRTSKTVLVACLADCELAIYCKNRDTDTIWSKVEHRVITRGLRGRASRKRKYAQPGGPYGRLFRGPVLTKFTNLEGILDGVFFAGHRPSFVFCIRGVVSVVPFASSVSCLLPPPVIPSAEENVLGTGGATTAGTSMSNASSSASSSAYGDMLASKKKVVPDPTDMYRVRGAVHSFCSFETPFYPGGFVCALRAPEGRIQTQIKSTALRFCSTSHLLQAEDFTSGIPVRISKLQHSNWCVTRVTFLPHASRGSEEESKLHLHAPTLAIVSSREESLRVDETEENVSAGAAAVVGGGGQDRLGAGGGGDVPELEPDQRLGGAPDIVITRQSIEVVRAPDYSRIIASFPLGLDERVLCMTTCTLNAPVDHSSNDNSNDATDGATTTTAAGGGGQPVNKPTERVPMPGLVVVGTAIIDARGEEASSRGRILVFTIDHVPDASLTKEEQERYVKVLGRPTTKPFLRMIASVELRGPISALAGLDGKVLAATGNLPCQLKLLELSPRNEGLIPVGFFDAPTCVVNINVIRDQYVLLGDMNKSLQFLRWKDRQFQLLGRTFENVRVFASEFALDGHRLLLCVGDDESNLRVWHFDPESQILQPRAELNLGMRIGKMRARRIVPLPPKQDESSSSSSSLTSMSALIPDPTLDPSAAANALSTAHSNRWCVIMGTLAGGLGSLVPIDEKSFRRLDLLQQAMTANAALLPRNAGLHPLQSSLPKGITQKRPTSVTKAAKSLRNIIDGRIIWRFVDLEKVSQRKIALSIGSTVDTILDTLLEIDLVMNW